MVVSAKEKVSIIVPVYNAGQFLEECIESVIAQTYGNLEIIIIDDGSTDESKNICGKYASSDSRIKYYDQKNSGVSAARNKGLAIATGEYITFVDADDTLQSDAIDVMTSLMRDSDADCVRTKCDVRNDINIKALTEDVHPGMYFDDELKKLSFLAVTGRMMCFTWLLMVRRDVIVNNNLRFPVGVLMMEDMWFYTDLLNSVNTMLISEKITYHYVVRDTGATRSLSDFDRKLDSIARVNRRMSNKGFNIDQMKHINAINAGNMVNFTIINAVRMNSTRNIYELLSKICHNKEYDNIYRQADSSKWGLYYKIACWAAFNKNRTILFAIVILRKISRR